MVMEMLWNVLRLIIMCNLIEIYMFIWFCNCFVWNRSRSTCNIYLATDIKILSYLSNKLYSHLIIVFLALCDAYGLELDTIASYLDKVDEPKSNFTCPQPHSSTQNHIASIRQGAPIDEPQTVEYSLCLAVKAITTTIATLKTRGVVTISSLFDALGHDNNKVEVGVAVQQFSNPLCCAR